MTRFVQPAPVIWPRLIKQTDRRGFTLLEALAALLVMALVVPVMMGAVRSSMQMAALSADRDLALTLADAQLQQIVLDQSWEDGDAIGVFETGDIDEPERIVPPVPEGDGRGFIWSLQVDDWLDSSVKQLTLTVSWSRSGRDHELTLVTAVKQSDDG